MFWVNIPVGIAALVLTALFVPESRAARPRRLDPIGQLLVIILLGSLTYAVIEGPAYGWGSARIMSLLAVAVVALAVFLSYEPRRREPLVDLRFFRSLPFSGATLTAVSAMGALCAPQAARQLKASDADGAAREVEQHLQGLHYMGRLACGASSARIAQAS